MESSPFLHPTFLLTAAIVLVTFIAWLTRLESKVNDLVKRVDKSDKSSDEAWAEFDHHRSNGNIHFNEKVAAEVDKGNERRFTTIEEQLRQVNVKLDTILRSHRQ